MGSSPRRTEADLPAPVRDTAGEEAIECGPDGLITMNLVRARGKGSGIKLEARGATLWAFQAGKILKGKLFQTREDALEAAGMSDQAARPN